MSKEHRVCSLPMCRGVRLDTVHRLPASAERRNAWLTVLNDYRDHLEKLQNPCICARHFRPEDYVHAESRKLNRVAVPSLNIKDLSQLDSCKQVRNFCTIQNAGETDKNEAILQSKYWTKAKQKNNSPNPDEREAKRNKLDTTDITELVDEEQNMYMTLDELKTLMLGQNEVVVEVNEYIEDEENEQYNELAAELAETFDQSSNEAANEFEENLTKANIENTIEEETIEQTSVQVSDAADYSSINDISIELDSHEIIIQHVNFAQTLHLNYLWLRDFCKCADCYDSTMHTRLFDVTVLSLELRPDSASLLQDNLLVEWNDGHISTYVIAQLFAQYKQQKTCIITNSQTLWSAKQTQNADFEAMSLNDLICDNHAVKMAFKRLQRTGVLLIKDISAHAQQKPLMLELLLRRLFPHNYQSHTKERRSYFHNSQTLPHTNCTFLSESSGLQILSLNPACAAETLNLNIVDGLNAVQLLNQNARQVFNYLTHYKVPLIYRNEQNYEYHTEAPIIQLYNEEVERIRFAPYQRGNMPQQDLQQFNEALARLSSIIKQKQHQWKLCLGKSMLCILDNYRICWQVEDVESDIALDCIYMERKDFLSQLHCLQYNG